MTPARAAGAASPPVSWGTLALLFALMAATLAVYQPAWTGTLLWDDDGHITKPALRTFDGLRRIWFDVGATQQYYPLVHSAFWLQHRLWGDATLGYHLVNILLHACSAFLIGLILRRLAVPGAWLAAAIFALHPVHVESVAWISELKNTLSGLLYLGAGLVYLGYDQSRRRRSYAGAMVLFVLALLSKTTTAMLPAVLIVVLWWKRGAISWRRDLLPLGPFFVIGAAAGLTTASFERTLIGAQGADYDFTLIERGLIAGRATWFYLTKLVWPSPLVFSYPRWNVSQAVWWQYLYPLAVVALLAAAWGIRSRTRAPLAVLLAFIAALFPVLGFFNVYPFVYSFVADHFQYLASIPVIALLAAGGMRLLSWAAPRRRLHMAAGAIVALALFGLAALTVRASSKYTDITVLYEATLRDNPSSLLAHLNLGKIIAERGTDLESAVQHFQAVAAIEPDRPEGYYNMGLAYVRMGRPEAAVASYEKAVRVAPTFADGYAKLCDAQRAAGRLQEARADCERAVALAPGLADAQLSLGETLRAIGQPQEALAALSAAARLAPREPLVHHDLGSVLLELGRPAEAEAAFRESLELRPANPFTLANLGLAVFEEGRVDEAMRFYREALRLRPEYADARYYLGNALQSVERLEEAIAQYRLALAVNPSDAPVHNNLGLALERVGRPGEAAVHYREALRLRPSLLQAQEGLGRTASRR